MVAGLLIALIVTQAGRRDPITGSWRQVIPAAGAALACGIASGLHGSGFIAAFVAGMVFRLALRRDPEELNRLTERLARTDWPPHIAIGVRADPWRVTRGWF